MTSSATYQAMGALVSELRRCGVRDACLSPGSRSAPIAFALAREPGVRVWVHLDERCAGFFALGLARATRRPVAVACTSGSAAANLLPAAVEAHHARVPLILLTADRPPELHDRSAHQTIDQRGLFGSHTRWSFDLGVADDGAAGVRHVRSAACRAFAEAAGDPPGVVHLNLPLREPLEPPPGGPTEATPVDAGAASTPATTSYPGVGVPSAADLESLTARLVRARRPLVYCGASDGGVELSEGVRELAARLGAPILAEPVSNVRRPALGPRLVVPYEAMIRASTFAEAHRPDLVVRVGRPPTSRVVASWLDEGGSELVVIGDARSWADPSGRARHVVRGDPAATCHAIAAATRDTAAPCTGAAAPGWCDRWTGAAARAESALALALEVETEPFEGHVVRAVVEALRDDERLYVGNSLAVRDLDWFWPAGAAAPRVLANRGANGIDGFVSSALGAAAGGAPVLGLCGDLTFLHDLGGLAAARRLGVRAVFVVVNNGGGGIFDFLPVARSSAPYAEHYEELFVAPPGVAFGPLVQACGLRFESVGSIAGIGPAIERSWRGGETSVVEVVVRREHSVAAHARAWEAVQSALREAA